MTHNDFRLILFQSFIYNELLLFMATTTCRAYTFFHLGHPFRSVTIIYKRELRVVGCDM